MRTLRCDHGEHKANEVHTEEEKADGDHYQAKGANGERATDENGRTPWCDKWQVEHSCIYLSWTIRYTRIVLN